jgi:hypothetical protein
MRVPYACRTRLKAASQLLAIVSDEEPEFALEAPARWPAKSAIRPDNVFPALGAAFSKAIASQRDKRVLNAR